MKSQFKTACRVEVSDKSGMFVLIDDLIYYSERLGKNIAAPKGFETDFASIPWMFRWLIKVNGKHRKPAVIHDYLCVHGKEMGISQSESDHVFQEAMNAVDVRRTQNAVMFGMVRAYQSIKGVFT